MSASAKSDATAPRDGSPPPSEGAGATVPAPATPPVPGPHGGKPGAAANEPSADGEDAGVERNNLIKRTVDEIYALMAEVHEIREELLAHGVQFHMLNALIELGVHDKPDEQAKMVTTAVEASVSAHGPQAIERAELEAHLEAIVTLEKDLRHVRHVASQQGVHMQALNHLTQLMRLNPGDRGTQAINTFVAYADAAGVPLDRVRDILGALEEEPDSVLPDVPRTIEPPPGAALRELLGNLAVGLALTVGVMWLVL